MGSWLKWDADFIVNAKVGRAVALAEDADRVFTAMLCLHAKFGSGGLIPASHCEPDGLRIEASATLGRISEKRIADAIAACVKVGLLRSELGETRRDSAGLRLVGFDEKHMPECSRCRRPNPEPSHGNCPECRAEKAENRRMNAIREGHAEPRAEKGRKGHARADAGQDGARPPLPDRTGQDRTGREAMDGEMDGGDLSASQNRSTVPAGTRHPGRPVSAGSVLRQLDRGAS